MSGRPIRKDRFELLDELGIGYVCKFYVEGNMSVQSLWSRNIRTRYGS
jgi:hypothetical protein